MSEALLTALPEPNQFTLLFKQAKQTVLLSVYPTQPFSEIKSLLLAALNSRNITSIRNVADGPLCPVSQPEDLEFAILADRKDASKGWVPLQPRDVDMSETKLGKKKAGGKRNTTNDSPEGAGLTDGSWVAFRVKISSTTGNEEDKEDEEDEEDADDTEIEEDAGWNVVLPTFEEEAD